MVNRIYGIMNMDIHSGLVNDLKNGSSEAFNALYEIYADLLYGFVLDLTKSPSDAKDIVQDVFLKIWNHHAQLSPELSFRAYLYKIARNQIIDSFRKQVETMTYDSYICSEHVSNQIENNVEREIYFKELSDHLEEAKGELTERQKIIFEMSREQGMTIRMIAEELGLSEQTVKNQLTIALKHLRQQLSRYTSFVLLFL